MIEYKAVEAEIYNYRAWVVGEDINSVVNKIDQCLKYAGYTILKFVDYQFPIKGYTSMWLLAESHMALHFFADENKTYIELSGCNYEMNRKFREKLESYKLKIEEL